MVQGSGLHRCTGGHKLVVTRDPYGASGEIGHDPPVGPAVGGTADEVHRSPRRPAERVGPGEQIADHAFDGGPGQLARRHVGAQPG